MPNRVSILHDANSIQMSLLLVGLSHRLSDCLPNNTASASWAREGLAPAMHTSSVVALLLTAVALLLSVVTVCPTQLGSVTAELERLPCGVAPVLFGTSCNTLWSKHPAQ